MTEQVIRLENSWPFDSYVGDGGVKYDKYGYSILDRAVLASALRGAFRQFFTSGVFGSPADNLKVVASSGLAVKICPGWAVIDGGMAGVEAEQGLEVALSDTPPRGDVVYSVFAMLDDNSDARSIYLRVVDGAEAVAPRNEGAVHELRLATVAVPSGATDLSAAVLADERGTEVCPYVAPFMEVDVSGVLEDVKQQAGRRYAQFVQYLTENMAFVASAIEGTTAGYLQNHINSIQASLDDAVQRLDYIDESLESDAGLSALRERMGLGETLGVLDEAYGGTGGMRLMDKYQLETLIGARPTPYLTDVSSIKMSTALLSGMAWAVGDVETGMTTVSLNSTGYNGTNSVVSINIVKVNEDLVETVEQFMLLIHAGRSPINAFNFQRVGDGLKWVVTYNASPDGSNSATAGAFAVDVEDGVASGEFLGAVGDIYNQYDFAPSYPFCEGGKTVFAYPASRSNQYITYVISCADGVATNVQTPTGMQATFPASGILVGVTDDDLTWIQPSTSSYSYITVDRSTLTSTLHTSGATPDMMYPDEFHFFASVPIRDVTRSSAGPRAKLFLQSGASVHGDRYSVNDYDRHGDMESVESMAAFKVFATQLNTSDRTVSLKYNGHIPLPGRAGAIVCPADVIYVCGGSESRYELDVSKMTQSVKNSYVDEMSKRPRHIPAFKWSKLGDGTYRVAMVTNIGLIRYTLHI